MSSTLSRECSLVERENPRNYLEEKIRKRSQTESSARNHARFMFIFEFYISNKTGTLLLVGRCTKRTGFGLYKQNSYYQPTCAKSRQIHWGSPEIQDICLRFFSEVSMSQFTCCSQYWDFFVFLYVVSSGCLKSCL